MFTMKMTVGMMLAALRTKPPQASDLEAIADMIETEFPNDLEQVTDLARELTTLLSARVAAKGWHA